MAVPALQSRSLTANVTDPATSQVLLAAFDELTEAVALFAADGRLLYANRRFDAAFDTDGSIHDLDAFDALFAPVGERPARPITTGSSLQTDEPLAHGGGWFRLRWQAVADDSGEVNLLLTASDISQRMEDLRDQKAHQEQLLFTAKRMSVGEMATTLAHELNQPLSAIINYLSVALNLLESVPQPPARLADAIGLARTQAQHAADVISTMREFVRAREPQRAEHELDEIATAVMRLLQLEAQRNRVRMEIAIDDNASSVLIDRIMIEQVLLNLVKNAIEAMTEVSPADRIVRIEARVNLDGQSEVRVCDRGKGLSAEQAIDVFKPFVSSKADGLGVGLAICRSIVEYHEGRLYFEPNRDGGSVFVFTLPRSERHTTV